MLCILRDETDPYFNIAAEEYILRNFTEDVFMIWISRESLVMGKHQNPFEEIDGSVFLEGKLPVIRRISGGGTVYHDPGNINFTFVFNGEAGKLVDYPRFLNPVTCALKNMGIEACRGPRNEIISKGFKISGNAQHVYKNRVLHHGTLLYSSHLEIINTLLNPVNGIQSKALKSVPGNVGNIADLFNVTVPVDRFKTELFHHVMGQFPNAEIYSFNENDRNHIRDLVQKKYKTWEWNFGYTTDFKVKKRLIHDEYLADLELFVSRGIIISVSLSGDALSDKFNVLKKLQGVKFLPAAFRKFEKENHLKEIFTSTLNKSLSGLLFT